MKKTISAAVGGINFIIDEDAYQKLSSYLDRFREGLDQAGSSEVMDELEMRIADLFKEKLSGKEVVDSRIVDSVISQLGLPGGGSYEDSPKADTTSSTNKSRDRKRLFRDKDDKMIAGVCSGLGYYFDVDPTILRIGFVLALLCGSAGFWIYVLLMFIVPYATTAAEKCEMHGLDLNADNIRRFSSSSNNNYRK